MTKKEHFLYYRWKDMMDRCYRPTHKSYGSYGAKGVEVSEELQDFWTYVSIVSSLDNYDKLQEGWQIDKDKLSTGTKIYSKETIQIISPVENKSMIEHSGGVKSVGVVVEFIDGTEQTYQSSDKAGRELGIDGSSIRKIANGKSSGKTIFKRKGIRKITWQSESRGK